MSHDHMLTKLKSEYGGYLLVIFSISALSESSSFLNSGNSGSVAKVACDLTEIYLGKNQESKLDIILYFIKNFAEDNSGQTPLFSKILIIFIYNSQLWRFLGLRWFLLL